MSKFKFGDKVFCSGLFGNGIYHKCSYHEQEEPMCYVLFENYGLKVVELSSITKVSDWIPCSERMPEFSVRVLVINKLGGIKTDYLLGLYDNGSPDWGDYENYTYWMPLPDMPEVKE